MILNRFTLLYGISILYTCITLNGMPHQTSPATSKIFMLDTMVSARAINDEELKSILANRQNLEVLRLEKCTSLSPDSLSILTNHHNIQVLFLIDCPTLTDTSLKFLKTLPHLQTFLIAHNPNITDALFETLAHCTALKKIYILSCDTLNGNSLPMLNNHINLRELYLSDCQNITIPEELYLPHIEKLNISYNPKINKTCLATIAQCTSLKSLDLSGPTTIQFQDLQAIKNLAHLEELYVFTPLINAPESPSLIMESFPHAKKIGYYNHFIINDVINTLAEGYFSH